MRHKRLFPAPLLLMLLALLAAGCETLAVDLIEIAGEPDKIYHSGKDLLSGDYEVIGRPGTKYDKSEPVSLRFDEKGWKMSKDGEMGLHIYELPPEQADRLFSRFDPETMQCAGTAKVTDFLFCRAPKGTRIRHGKVHESMHTGYIVIFDGNWNNAEPR